MVFIPSHTIRPPVRGKNETPATMNKRPWQISLTLPLAAALAFTAVVPAGRAEPPPQKIDVSQLKYQVDEVVVPNPSEVFAALDKMGMPNWKNVELPVSGARFSKPPEIAMLLGVVIANGFVAVEAKDKDEVDKIGRKVRELSAALSVDKYVIEHSNAIVNAAKNDDWNGVRTELDKAKSSVRDGMLRLNSKDEAELVSIAGWLRGTHALTTVILAEYKPERAELLHQPDLLSTFEKQFDGMKKAQGDKKVMDLRDGLKKVKALILSSGAEPLPQKTVEEIHRITDDLVKSISP